MATIELNETTFGEIVTSPGIVFVDLWAEWCGPCRMFGPIFEEASNKNEDIIFAKVDTEKEQQLSAMLGITSIPTLLAFRDGIMLYNRAGALPAANFDELIGAVRAVNMDEVRAEIAKGPAGDEEGNA
ncbi:MAG: thioredoxin family protein [Micrococcales bacterium]